VQPNLPAALLAVARSLPRFRFRYRSR
jgi:hypothetical protein